MSDRHVCHDHTTQWLASAGIGIKMMSFAAHEGVTCVQVSACLGTGTKHSFYAVVWGQVGSGLTKTERYLVGLDFLFLSSMASASLRRIWVNSPTTISKFWSKWPG